MVNYGVSRGCETCKMRRKKCDESRPYCNTCAKAKRVCLGYKNGSGLLFRNYAAADGVATHAHHDESQNPDTRPTWVLYDGARADLDDLEIEKRAAEFFLEDFCVESADRSTSRGFLDGLRALINCAGQSADLTQAAKVVGLASIGNRLGRQKLVRRAELLYGRLLGSFHATLSKAPDANTVEALMTAVLLGLYEIVSCTEHSPSQHDAHVKGVTAILSQDNSPFYFDPAVRFFRLSNPLSLKGPVKQPRGPPGLLCAPASDLSIQTLDEVLAKFGALFSRAAVLIAGGTLPLEDLEQIKDEAIAIDKKFEAWETSQTDEWRPRKSFFRHVNALEADQRGNRWLGSTESYFDLYVSSTWNTYRKTRLMVLDLIVTCSKRLPASPSCSTQERIAQSLSEDLLASIPYHLSADQKTQLLEPRPGSELLAPARPVGGLLLMHPLYTATRLKIVPCELREKFNEHLAWIGRTMGIGMAAVLSQPFDRNSFAFVAIGHVLIWAGMVIQPPDP